MTKLSDLFDPERLAHHAAEGNVSRVQHPTEPLTLYNYTQRCQFSGAWDEVTRSCRGLIVGPDEMVLARPFPKFHNLYEHGAESAAGPIELAAPLRVFDKLDGSLGIAYRRPSDGRIAWATRGSFTSDQAQWATDWWNAHHGDVDLPDGLTWLAEIIYPDNRIVVDYGDRAGLVLLAALDVATGHHVGPCYPGDRGAWPGEVVDVFDDATDVLQLDANDRPAAEGYVVLSGDRLTRVKLKGDEYMRLHKLLTGVSNVTVWDLLRNGRPLDELLEVVPDEFATWVKGTVAELTSAYDEMRTAARTEFDRIDPLLPDRKAFAAEAVKSQHRAVLFAMADDKKDVAGLIWRMVKPERSLPFAASPEGEKEEGAP